MITAQAVYHAHLLSNGRYSAIIGAAGGGCSLFDEFAITRWVPDPLCHDDGILIFIRDVDSGAFWTACAAPGQDCALSTRAGLVEYARAVDGIESELTIGVLARHDAELRRLTLHNASNRVRRLDVTTAAELALNTLAGDAAHPGFSRLFVQTEYVAAAEALLAHRRLRSPGDTPIFAAHRLIGGSAAGYETDRALFLGRGRVRTNPAALASEGRYRRTTGSVLDPIFSMRRTVVLQPGETASLSILLAAAHTREAALRIAGAFPDDDAVTATLRGGIAEAVAAMPAGVPCAWRETVSFEPAVPSLFSPDDRAGSSVRAPEPIEGGAAMPAAAARPDGLRMFNGWGGFSSDGAEYVILMPRTADGLRRPPLPWVNVIANPTAGCMVSESGATYTWAANSRENRITPWFNDPLRDPHGEALYIRDDETGEYWSPTPGPVPGRGGYEVRHGFGRTRFLHESEGLEQEVQIFVPEDLPARVVRVRVTNAGAAPRRVSVWSYTQLVLGTHEAETRGRVNTARESRTGALLASQPHRGEFSGRVAFSAVACDGLAALQWTTDRYTFIGDHGSVEAPASVAQGVLDGFTGEGADPCFALSLAFTLEPGGAVTCMLLLGEAVDEAAALVAVAACNSVEALDAALVRTRTAWQQRVSAIEVETPEPAIDLMVNGWLTYQNLSCRMWARSAYYQSGGAFGFRDQLQDSSALLYLDPELTRSQILLHAAHQFVEGDVLHWWHPPLSKGIRTRFADDLLWLPYVTAFYVACTGDVAILDERVRYLTAPLLAPEEDEMFLVPAESGTGGTLYEHCCRAIDRSMATGAHGLPLMGVGDWNDGMNRVGREGRGESVWLGFFVYDILGDFITLADTRGDYERSARYDTHRADLGSALNVGGWDGEWYRRAYYDNGAPLGSKDSDECRIDALAQAWAVISGAAPGDRAQKALDAMESHLVSERDGIIRLLEPAFDRTPHDPGYIKGYLPGVRENGGQYTHGVIWAVRALAEAGRGERAARLLAMLSPVSHGGSPERAERYKVEPYVIAADIYGVEPHVGRGGWTWYTGSAGWLYRVAIESVLGLELRGGTELRLRPCIPADWPGYRLRYRLPDGTVIRIVVERGSSVSSVTLDGGAPNEAMNGTLTVPLIRDGGNHSVHVVLGADVQPRYVPR
jgi:N,N'-diacetylchitobiose phosphorylase